MNAVVKDVRHELDKMQPQFKAALPDNIKPERFMRVVQTALQLTPELLNADRQSLFGACMKAAQDGLLPDGREGAFVTFWDKKLNANKVQWMPMVTGILKKVRNSGELLSITANLVHKNDEFSYWIDDTGEHLLHKPDLLATERGAPVAVYAIARTKDGGIYTEIMSHAQVEQVRGASRAKDSGPWVSWWGEMAKKTVIRRLAKKLPMSTDLEQVIQRDDELYEFQRPTQTASSGNQAVAAALGIEPVPATEPASDVIPWDMEPPKEDAE